MTINIGQTSDPKVFDIMERKYKVSQISLILSKNYLRLYSYTRDDFVTKTYTI